MLTVQYVLPQELLSTVQPDCEFHYVGKRGGQPSIKQQDIDKLLVSLCKQVRTLSNR
jgi:siroheme synthase